MNPAARIEVQDFFCFFLGLERKPGILCNQKMEEESENEQKKKETSRSRRVGKAPFLLYIIMWELLYEILRRNTLVVLYAADSLGKHISDGELLNLVATLGVRD